MTVEESLQVVHCAGRPRFVDTDLARVATQLGIQAAWSEAFARYGTAAAQHVEGDFSVAIRSAPSRVYLAVDKFSIRTLCYQARGNDLVFAERADAVAGASAEIDPQAIFDYLYFHMIPAPRTVFRNVFRIPAGHFVLMDLGRVDLAPYWTPTFDEDSRKPFEKQRETFLALLREALAAQLDGTEAGCFLSGGTDSSTVAGILGQVTGKPTHTFSIGFNAEGYDEMEYARTAARHFKTVHHEYYVTPEDLVRAIPSVAASFDQPFGNSSVIPAYYCIKMAKDAGIQRLLAGDGGDELFGGNTRYAKQRIFQLYEALPGGLRRAMIEPALLGSKFPNDVPGLMKAVSYVDQARIPMPERLQTYNLLMRLGLDEVLTPAFLASVDALEPDRQQHAVYHRCHANALINRMLAFDWKYTLADNDLPKVLGAARLIGMPVGFPLLDDRLLAFSMGLPADWKVKGLKLRWFFKEALRGFLPDEIITKKKHGFGLPFGVWLVQHAGLRDLALASLEGLRAQGFVRPQFIDRLIRDHLPQSPGYYGEMVWILMMLSQWLAANASSNSAAETRR